MIDTELKFLENDIAEVINLFVDKDSVNLRHRFTESENKIVNTITVNGRVFAYGNLITLPNDEIVRKRLIKRYAKLSAYKALSKVFEKEMPWGALTGIRPTKLAYLELEERGSFSDFFTDTMKVSKEKTELVEKIIETQKGIYKKDDNNTDFFVFIPFCPSRCKYCSFITSDIKRNEQYVDAYVDTLIREIEESKDYIKNLRSIYIGGGTPVALDDRNLDKVLTAIDKINKGVEYTVEAGRPDRITESNLKILKDHGVTRICINPQTFNDNTLQLLGRNHKASEIEKKYALAKGSFDINMDLIAGLPGETISDFKYSLDKAVALSPEDITVHTLCIKKSSYLAMEESRLNGDSVSEMVDYSYKTLAKNGYMPYYMYRQKYMAGNLENVGYCKEGKACVYNVNVMEEISSTVACGANAISKKVFNSENRIERLASPKDVKTYLEKIDTILSNKKNFFN